jgi:hypothetical protein
MNEMTHLMMHHLERLHCYAELLRCKLRNLGRNL